MVKFTAVTTSTSSRSKASQCLYDQDHFTHNFHLKKMKKPTHAHAHTHIITYTHTAVISDKCRMRTQSYLDHYMRSRLKDVRAAGPVTFEVLACVNPVLVSGVRVGAFSEPPETSIDKKSVSTAVVTMAHT